MTAGIMGAGSTSALILAGTWFRFDLLWVTLITLPAVVVCLDSGARIGVLSAAGVVPNAMGSSCTAHNLYMAEQDYGKEWMDQFRRSDDFAREPDPSFELCPDKVPSLR